MAKDTSQAHSWWPFLFGYPRWLSFANTGCEMLKNHVESVDVDGRYFYGIWRIILVLESWAFCESCLVSGGMWKPPLRQVGGRLLAWQKLRLSQIKWWSISLSKLFFFHQVSPKKCKKQHGTKTIAVPHLIVSWWTNYYFINKNQPFVTGFLRPPRPEAPKTKEVKETPAAATVASPLAAPIRRKTMMV